MDEKREYMNASLDWLCNPECRAKAVAYREEVERQPRPQPAAAAVASSSSNAPAGASSSSNDPAGASSSVLGWQQSSLEWCIDMALLKALGKPEPGTRPTMLQAKPSDHFGDTSRKFMCPVEPKMLDTIFPAGKKLLQRHGAAQVEELVVKQPPVIAVRRRGKDLRGVKAVGERQRRKRRVTHGEDPTTAQQGFDDPVEFRPANSVAPDAVAEDDDADPIYPTSALQRAASRGFRPALP
jgi:hypothetical protein